MKRAIEILRTGDLVEGLLIICGIVCIAIGCVGLVVVLA